MAFIQRTRQTLKADLATEKEGPRAQEGEKHVTWTDVVYFQRKKNEAMLTMGHAIEERNLRVFVH